jgi:Flp pilus assembly protein TadB
MSKRLQWGGAPDAPSPKSPVRDTLLVYGVLSLIIILVAWATGGPVGRALIIVPLFYVVASAWTITRLRSRARQEAAKAERE